MLRDTLEDLQALDRQDRIDYLISLAQEFKNAPSDEVPRTSETRVPGCESEVYIVCGPKIAVDNPQGVSAMALAVILQGADLTELTTASDDIVYRIFGKELSMGKSMGLTGMVRMARELARREMNAG